MTAYANIKPMSDAPKTGADFRAKCFLGWCPDKDAPDGGDWRIIWWEPKLNGGCWYGDRELPENPVGWVDLPPIPQRSSPTLVQETRP